MRWIITLLFVLLAQPSFAQENEAEKLFRAMEKKVRDAPSVRVLFDLKHGALGPTATFKGAAHFADAGRWSLKNEWFIPGGVAGTEGTTLDVSNGKQKVELYFDPPGHNDPRGRKAEPQPAVANLDRLLLAVIARAGGRFAYGFRYEKTTGGRFDIDKLVPVSDFKMVPEDTEAQVIEYQFTVEGRDVYVAKLWIDIKTGLPLKRRFTQQDNKKNSYEETYTEFILDPQLDPKLFELPK